MTVLIPKTTPQAKVLQLINQIKVASTKFDEYYRQNKPRQSNQQSLRHLVSTHFKEIEFIEIVTNLGLDYDHIYGKGYTSKIRETIIFLRNRGMVNRLVNECQTRKPTISWQNFRDNDIYFQILSSQLNDLSNQVQVGFLLTNHFSNEEIRDIAENFDIAFHKIREYVYTRPQLAAVLVTYAIYTNNFESLIKQMAVQRPYIATIQNLPDLIAYTEFKPVKPTNLFGIFPKYKPQPSPKNKTLAFLLNAHFSEIELDEMLFDSGNIPDMLGKGKESKITGVALAIEQNFISQLAKFLAACHIREPQIDWASAAEIEPILISKLDTVCDENVISELCKSTTIRKLMKTIWSDNTAFLSFCETNFPNIHKAQSITLSFPENSYIFFQNLTRENKTDKFLEIIQKQAPVQHNKFKPYH